MPVLVNAASSCLVDYLFRRVWLPRVPSVHQYHDWLADVVMASSFNLWGTPGLALLKSVGIERFERFIAQDGVAPLGRRRGREYKHPARGNETRSEGKVTRINDMYAHEISPSAVPDVALFEKSERSAPSVTIRWDGRCRGRRFQSLKLRD